MPTDHAHGRDRLGPPGRRTAYEVLAVASRALVLEQVRAHPAGVDTATLARATGLHPNTVRFHLDVLAEAGLVTVTSDPAGKPGRPRRLFSPARVPPPPGAPGGPGAGGPPGQASQDGYALLAAALTAHLARTAQDPGAAAQAAGRSWATDATAQDGPDQALTAAGSEAGSEVGSVAQVSALFEELGFAPQTIRDREGWRILLHRCPFHTLAAEHPEIVCRLHLGLLQGALDRLGHDGGPVRLQPFIAPGLCESFVPLTALGPSSTTPTAPRPLGPAGPAGPAARPAPQA